MIISNIFPSLKVTKQSKHNSKTIYIYVLTVLAVAAIKFAWHHSNYNLNQKIMFAGLLAVLCASASIHLIYPAIYLSVFGHEKIQISGIYFSLAPYSLAAFVALSLSGLVYNFSFKGGIIGIVFIAWAAINCAIILKKVFKLSFVLILPYMIWTVGIFSLMIMARRW